MPITLERYKNFTMRINFLTTEIADASGGAIYDRNFYEVLKKVHPKTNLYNDKLFIERYNKGSELISFNLYYRQSIDELLNCDYLVINSRLYTRMMLFDIGSKMTRHPKTKLLVIHHHSNFMNNEGLRRKVHKFYEKRVLESASELIIPNEYVVDQVKKDFRVNMVKFLPSSFEKKVYPISPLDSNILLFVGNVEHRKGLLYGIKAFEKISNRFPNLKFHIAGKYDENDSYYQSLRQYVSENGLEKKVLFEGRVSNKRLEWLYENARLFLFPSLLEGYGWVMVEAMGRGLPVVAFNNSAMPYTVKDGINGLLIDNKNDEEMAKRTIELLSDRAGMLNLQKGALITYEHVPSQDDLNRLTEEYIKSWR